MKKQKTNPFRVPGNYFESLPGRLNDRIANLETEQVPVRAMKNLRIGLAVAAAVAILALVTFPLVRTLSPLKEAGGDYLEIALLDGAGLFASDYELASYLEEPGDLMDDKDAYINQAIEYLASSDVEMNLIFE